MFWLENLKESDHLKDLCTDKKDNIKVDLIKDGRVSTGFIWHNIGISGGEGLLKQVMNLQVS